MKKTRIAVTGIGVVSSTGVGTEKFWRNLLAGKSGIKKISSFDSRDFRTHMGGEVEGFDAKSFMKDPCSKNTASQYAIAAVRMALRDSGLKQQDIKKADTAVIVGTMPFDQPTFEKSNRKLSLRLVQRGTVNTPAREIGQEFGLKGSIFTVSTVCSSGNYALGLGLDLIKQGRAERVICCGTDVISQTLHAGFNRLFAVAPEKCQPFDKNRKGMIIGEGAGALIIENFDAAIKRKTDIYAEVLGYGLSCDAFSLTIPSEVGVKMVMRSALKNANLKKENIDYINAHGTGTINNDKVESSSIKQVFGKHAKNISVTSIKSILGHAINAASSIEAASCCLSLRDGIIPPTINYQTPDPECDIKVVANKAEIRNIKTAMNNSFAFGGNNACVIFAKV